MSDEIPQHHLDLIQKLKDSQQELVKELDDTIKKKDAEIQYLNRMLGDERSGDCDLRKTIHRLNRQNDVRGKEIDRLTTIISFYNMPEQMKFWVRCYAELSKENRMLIDNLLEALVQINNAVKNKN